MSAWQVCRFGAGKICAVRTYTDLQPLLDALDGLDLPPGSWIATDADGTLWSCDVADEGWRKLIAERRLRPACAPALTRILLQGGRDPSGDLHGDARLVQRLFMDQGTNKLFVLKGNGVSVDLEAGGGGGGGLQFASQQFVPTPLQTVFTLSQPPVGRTIMFANGLELFEGDAFNVVGTTLTFIPAVAGFTLGVNDIVDVYIEV